MKSFISSVVQQFTAEDPGGLKHYAFVFPTRRAGYYFRETLLEVFPDKTFWLPHILSIEDFVVHCTGRVISNEIELLFALYQAYSSTYLPPPQGGVDKEELPTFDKFFAWGQVLLKDFDEVDRHMVNVKELYRNLEQLHELEERYRDNDEILFALKRFNQMMGQEPTVLTANFKNQWSRVSKTYHTFKKYLDEGSLSYTGMLYRALAQQLEQGASELPFEKVIFAGFNALSKSEEIIIDRLLNQNKAMVFWDADRLYLENRSEEAGKFMRRNYRKWPPSEQVLWIITDMVNQARQISIIGGVHMVGQAQVVGQLLSTLSEDDQDHCGIILADEGLLFPLLYALPENIRTLNVTMGYPVRQSQWFRLANSFMTYQLNLSGKADKVYAETQRVAEILSNPLIQRAVPSSKHLNFTLKQKGRWMQVAELIPDGGSEILKLSFEARHRVGDLIKSLVTLLMTIYQKLRLDQALGQMETEFAYHSLKQLMKLEEQISRYQHQLEPETLARLMIQAFEQSKIPFSGEPVSGLQLMGFLETRAVDFKKVILVSVNEGKLPRGIQFSSYLPYAIRKAFKLPTYEDQDAIYAYHFKRVLQRASNISILYNTEVAIDGSGEKSRYIWQLLEAFPRESITEYIYQISLSRPTIGTRLEIPKTTEVLNEMQRFLVNSGEVKAISPTAIRHYLDCSLRFYFRYVTRIPERETVSTELDARDFGNIVHWAFEKFYEPFIGQEITRVMLEKRLAGLAVEEAVEWTLQNHFREALSSVTEGKAILQKQIIEKLLYKAIYRDLRQTPFLLTGTELKVTADLEIDPSKTVRLEGKLDRVHFAREAVHIIDYKTGKADFTRPDAYKNQVEQYVQAHFDDPKLKSGFQGLFYGYLWNLRYGVTPLRLGVYPLKKVNEGIQWLYHGQVIPSSGWAEFERLLSENLRGVFDQEKPFTQTENTDLCRYCAYKEICQR